MINNACSPLKDEMKSYGYSDQAFLKNNSMTVDMNDFEKELTIIEFADENKKELNIFVSIFNFFKHFTKELSGISTTHKSVLIDSSIVLQTAKQSKLHIEPQVLIAQHYFYRLLANNSLKADEKDFPETSINRRLRNALAPENEMRIQGLIEVASSEIDEYSAFEENWDGYKAKKFSGETISLAKKVLNDIKTNLIVKNFIPEEITPGPASDGSLAIEILFKDKDLIITILPDTTSTINIYTNDGIINKETPISYPSDLTIYFEWLRLG